MSDPELRELALGLTPSLRDAGSDPLNSQADLHRWMEVLDLTWAYTFPRKGITFRVVSQKHDRSLVGTDSAWDYEFDLALGTNRSRSLSLFTALSLLQSLQ